VKNAGGSNPFPQNDATQFGTHGPLAELDKE